MKTEMLLVFFSFALLSAMLPSCKERDEGNELPYLPSEIRSLPELIRVAAKNSSETKAVKIESLPYPYTWSHSVTVESNDKEIQIVEFGVFVLIDGEWVDATENQKPYSKELFAEWFSCPDAKLIPGKHYTSDNFGNASSMLPEQNRVSRWYFIGESENGRCRGEITLTDINSVK